MKLNPVHTVGFGRAPRWLAVGAGALALGVCTLPVHSQSAVESAVVRGATAQGAARAGAAVRTTAAKPPVAVAPQASAAATPMPASGSTADPSRFDAGPSCIGGLPVPTPVTINAGRATLINLPEPITRSTLGDPEIVSGRLVSPQVLYLASTRIGRTNAILQGTSGRCVVLEILVAIDTDAILAKIGELMPAEKNIRVTAAGDSIVLSGVVSDTIAIDRAVSIANAFVRTSYQQGFGPGAANSPAGRIGAQTVVEGIAPLLARVVNMLSVMAPQQVMLEVKVAEVSKTLLDKLGVRLAGTQYRGTWTYQIVSDLLLGGTGGASIGANRNAGNGLSLEADKRDGLVRVLAEPTVMAISGQEGSFLAGGKILIPVAQSATTGGAPLITLEEKEFGVGLKFTPTVLADGRINLRVQPEVSELSSEGVGISSTAVGGRSILPLITTRRAATTVQLFDGQSFAIGGLIKNNISSSINAFPILGELPIIGALFRSSSFQSDKSELVFVVTPRLVKPLPPDYRLPTDAVGEPTRRGVIVEGVIDGPAARGAGPAAAMPPASPKAGGMELK